MISDKDLPELKNYRRLEKNLPIEIAPILGPLVVSGDNESSPVHRWFRYKEAYSAQLLEQVLSRPEIDTAHPLTLLDNYCGVATSLLSAQVKPDQIKTAIGVERNPFVAFVARAKLGWPNVDTRELEHIVNSVLSVTRKSKQELPELSSIRTGRCISKHIAGRVLGIRNSLLAFPDSPARDALLVGLASVIEPLSRTRKDGRALRLVDRTHQHVIPALRRKWAEIASDVCFMQTSYKRVARTKVKEGDGRCLRSIGIEERSIDIVLTSPPYPNNIDYSEVYKLELWLLGFVNSNIDFLHLRKSTLRSHPTSDLIRDPEPDFLMAMEEPLLKPFFDPLAERTAAHEERWRNKLMVGYFSDLWSSLREQYRCLRPGGRVFTVLGNSLHGTAGKAYLIPTDLLAGQIGRAVGFQLERICLQEYCWLMMKIKSLMLGKQA